LEKKNNELYTFDFLFRNFFPPKIDSKIFILSTHFGPFEGELRKDDEESQGPDYEWEVLNPEKTRHIGYVDPGKNPDKVSRWLAYVNCPLEESKFFTLAQFEEISLLAVSQD
jgi:hypothetical protein